MSRKNDYYKKLDMNAAQFSEDCMIVRARIVEAADTMAHIEVSRAFPTRLKSFWPEYQDEIIGGHSVGYNNNEMRYRYRPDAQAISRAEEVFYNWFPKVNDERRPLLCAWAFCLAVPKKAGSFGRYCKKRGIVRRTAERRIDAVIQDITVGIIKIHQSLQQPSWKRVSQLLARSGIDLDKMATVTFWRADDAKPAHRPELQEVA